MHPVIRELIHKRARELFYHPDAALTWPEALEIADHECRCGARCKTKDGRCMMRPLPGKKRCRWHGGLSCGPRSPEARERLRQRCIERNKAYPRVNGKLASPKQIEEPYHNDINVSEK